jgi:hypothetical protein
MIAIYLWSSAIGFSNEEPEDWGDPNIAKEQCDGNLLRARSGSIDARA